MSTQIVLPVERAAVSAYSKANLEPDWMTELRLGGLELAGKLGLPKLEKTKTDHWNLESYGDLRQSQATVDPKALPEAVAQLIGDSLSENALMIRNTDLAYTQLSEEAAAKGVLFMDLRQALKEHGELVRKYFMQAIKQDENRITALHSALWSGGVFLYVPKNVEIEVPFQALVLASEAGVACSPHVLIVAEAGSSVTYVENWVANDDKADLVVNGVVEVFAHEGAQVRVASLHHLGKAMTDWIYRRAILDKDANVDWIVGELTGGNVASETLSILKGNGSASNLKVICIGSGEQKMNLTTRAVHIGLSTTSDMITRAVMRDEATAIINGITKIEKGATGANGEQTEKVMMLSSKARGDANPILLIDEDDVKCGHAASVGQVSEEQIYYMMSRGITREEATRLIVNGFLAPVVSEVPLARVEEQLRRLVERKLA